MPSDYTQEISIAIIASIALFVCIAVVLTAFILRFQKNKYLHKEELHSVEEENKRQLVQSKLEVEEQTRLYIARELHDNIGTLSSLLKINLNLIADMANENKRTEIINESKDLVKTLITDVKQLSLSLNTDRISKMSLSQTIKLETERIKKLNLFLIDFKVEGDEWPIPSDKQIILYRICQELFHNTIKYAKAFKLIIFLYFEKDKLSISIEDDGIGFSQDARSHSTEVLNGSGLINVVNRTKLIGGNIFIDSSPGKGTKCYIEVPFINA